MSPDFSIIIPTFNSLPLLQKALNSVIKQRQANYEIIITDDSINNDIENYILDLENPYIRYLHNTPPLGAVANWNNGLKYSMGKYIIIMHHDEYLENEFFLSSIKQKMISGADITVADVKVYIGNKVHGLSLIRKIKPIFLLFPFLLFGLNAIGPSACICFKKELSKTFNEHLHWLVDVEWYYRILKKKKVISLQNNMYIVSNHGHEGQITETIDIKKARKRDVAYIRQLYPYKLHIHFLLWINGILFSNCTKKIIKKIIK